MNILVTGGAGFIGSNFIRHMLSKHNYTIVNLDLLTYAGNLQNLKDIEHTERYHFVKGDIRNRELLTKLFHQFDIQAVIHFAAESHVDKSIDDPEIFINTNVLGTQALLDTAKQYWKINESDKYCTDYKENVKFIQISTVVLRLPSLAPYAPQPRSQIRRYAAQVGVQIGHDLRQAPAEGQRDHQTV